MGKARCLNRVHIGRDVVKRRIGFRRCHRDRIDVACMYFTAKEPRRGDGENAAASAEVQNGARLTLLRHAIEH